MKESRASLQAWMLWAAAMLVLGGCEGAPKSSAADGGGQGQGVDVGAVDADGEGDSASVVPKADAAMPSGCDDGDPCTINDSSPAAGCQPAVLNCDDGNACTTDSCTAGQCVHAAVDGCANCSAGGNCDAGNGDTLDAMDADSSDASDSNDASDIGVPLPANPTAWNLVPTNCDDGSPCTIDAMTAKGCSYLVAKTGLPCDDGSACGTTAGACPVAWCQPGGKLYCDDANPCTVDVCDMVSGCVYKPGNAGQPCQDGNACTLGDTCGQGACLPGAATVCADDGDPCTQDGCSPMLGCQHVVQTCPASDACGLPGKLCGGKCVAVPGERWYVKQVKPSGWLKNYCSPGYCYFNHGPKTLALNGGGFVHLGNGEITWLDAWGSPLPMPPALKGKYNQGEAVGADISPDGLLGVARTSGPYGAEQGEFEVWSPSGLISSEKVDNLSGSVAWTGDSWTVHGPASSGTMWRFGVHGGLQEHRVNFAPELPIIKPYDPVPAWLIPLQDRTWLIWGKQYVKVGTSYVTTVRRRDSMGNLLWTSSVTADLGSATKTVAHPDGSFTLSGGDGGPWNSYYGGATGFAHVAAAGVVLAQGFAGTAEKLEYTKVFATSKAGSLSIGPISSPYYYNAYENGATKAIRIGPDGAQMWQKVLQVPGFADAAGEPEGALLDDDGSILGWSYDKSTDYLFRASPWGHTSCAEAGKCAALSLADCDDKVACTRDSCDPTIGCVHSPAEWDCADGDPCTHDSCSAQGCSHKPTVGNTCADSDPCVVGETCTAAGCKSTRPPCDDQNDCSLDACKPSGCSHELTSGTCDDGKPCTDTACKAGTCQVVALSCPCTQDADCYSAATCAVPECNAGQCAVPPAGAPSLLGHVDLEPVNAGVGNFFYYPQYGKFKTLPAEGGGLLRMEPLKAAFLRTNGKTQWSLAASYAVMGGTASADGKALLVGRAADGKMSLHHVSPAGIDITGAVLDNAETITALVAKPKGGWWILGRGANGPIYRTCRVWSVDAAGAVQWAANPMQSPSTQNQCNAILALADGSTVVAGARLSEGDTHLDRVALAATVGPTGGPGYYTAIGDGTVLGLVPDGQGGAAALTLQPNELWWVRIGPQGKVADRRRLAYDTSTIYWPVGAALGQDNGDFVFVAGDRLIFGTGAGLVTRVIEYSWKQKYTQPDAIGLARGPGSTLKLVVSDISWTPLKGDFGPYQFADQAHIDTYDAWGNASCSEAGACLGKPWSACADANPCTADRCDTVYGCHSTLFPDGTPCGVGKRCMSGQCALQVP